MLITGSTTPTILAGVTIDHRVDSSHLSIPSPASSSQLPGCSINSGRLHYIHWPARSFSTAAKHGFNQCHFCFGCVKRSRIGLLLQAVQPTGHTSPLWIRILPSQSADRALALPTLDSNRAACPMSSANLVACYRSFLALLAARFACKFRLLEPVVRTQIDPGIFFQIEVNCKVPPKTHRCASRQPRFVQRVATPIWLRHFGPVQRAMKSATIKPAKS